MTTKAGLFAGEVTTAAPADGALTTKFKGYQWMEYGNIIITSPSLPTLRDGLLAWYPLDEEQTYPYRQDVHSVNNAVTWGGQAYNAALAAGKVDGAAQYTSDVRDHIWRVEPHNLCIEEENVYTRTYPRQQRGNTDFTAVAWIYIDSYPVSVGQSMHVCGTTVYTGNGGEWGLAVSYDGKARSIIQKLKVSTSDYWTVESTETLAIKTWYFLMFEYEYATSTISISVNNGTPVSFSHYPDPKNPPNGFCEFTIGDWSQDTPDAPFLGRIDEVALWGRLLTDNEKSDLYNSGDGMQYPDQDVGTYPVLQGQEWSYTDGFGAANPLYVYPPEFIEAGDLLVIVAIALNTGISTPVTGTFGSTPSGWTQDAQEFDGDTEIAIFSKIADGTESIVTLTTESAEKGAWWLRINNAAKVDVVNIGLTEVASNTHVASELTTTSDNCLGISAICFNGGDGIPFSADNNPSAAYLEDWSYIEENDYRRAGTGNATGVIYAKNIPDIGPSDDLTITASVSDIARTVQLSIKPYENYYFEVELASTVICEIETLSTTEFKWE